jgi:hypothetical protein
MGDWKKISSKVAYQNPYYSIDEHDVIRPDGKEGKYFILNRKCGCRVIGVDENNKIIFVKIQNYPCDNYISLELPGGYHNPKMSEIESAKNEFIQETGLIPQSFEEIGKTFLMPRLTGAYDRIYLATNLTKESSIDNQEGDEGISKIERYTKADVLKMISSGEINDGNTLAAFAIFFSNSKFNKLLDV